MFKNINPSIFQVSIFLILIGFVLLALIKIIAIKSTTSYDQENSTLNSIVRMMDKTLRKPKACIQTFKHISLNYVPKNLKTVKSKPNSCLYDFKNASPTFLTIAYGNLEFNGVVSSF